MLSRREFMALAAVAGAGGWTSGARGEAEDAMREARRFHVCLGSKTIEQQPELLNIVRDAGVSDVWQAAFFYGHWYATPEQLREARARVEAAGLRWHVINLPFGHPGDSLGDSTGATPLTPPTSWQMGVRPDGSRYSGTSWHPSATEENVEAVRALAALKPDCIFLDDDFRLGRLPGSIGGCFCPWHRQRFLDKYGYTEARWEELLADVQGRRLTPLLRTWVEATCDDLTVCFRAQQAAAPEVALGNMIMYLGSEKAGIRLRDYADGPFRVGEMMFSDEFFNPVKGKTDELFSVLFHRRYAKPDLAYSETTAYPADQLFARNMAAKLATSTIADVRNTMYMSGMTPFPTSHWDVLGPAMRKQARFHELLKGHRPRGPFKHYWGEASRYVGDDKPFSLFLALGIPFEVSENVSGEGWTFLSDHDAIDIGANGPSPGPGTLVCRRGVEGASGTMRPIDESLDALWPLKREAIAAGLEAPYVLDDTPVVCAWYPTANAVLLWNLAEEKKTLRLHWSGDVIPQELDGLDVTVITR